MNDCYLILRTLADEGNFRAAADRLGVTQPYVSQFVKKLEEQCGVKLFDRTTRPLKLTEFGAIYLESRRKIAAIEKETAAFCADYANLNVGHVRIACNGERTSAMLVPVVREFQRRHPRVSLDFTLELHLEEIPDALIQGRAEVGILFETLMRPELSAYPLFRERYLLVMPDEPAYAGFGAKWNPEGRYPMVTETDCSGLKTLRLLQTLNHNERTPIFSEAIGIDIQEIPIRVAKLGTRLSFTAGGICASVCQESLIGPYADKERCRFASLEGILPVQQVVIAWHESEYRSRAAGEFCRIAVELLKNRRQNPAR